MLTRVDIEQFRISGSLPKGNLIYDMFDAIRMPYTGLSITDASLKKDRERIKRFVRACLKGHYYAAAFREESLDMLVKYNPKNDRQALGLEYDDVIRSRTEDGIVAEELQRYEIDIRAELINVPKDKIRPLAEIFDFSLATEVNRELKAAGWQPQR